MNKSAVLVVVDCQNDFMSPDGALYVPGAELVTYEVAESIRQAEKFDWIIVTQDWHSKEDYAKSSESKLFPEHCTENTWGAELVYGVTEALHDAFVDAKILYFKKPVFDIWAGSLDFVDTVTKELKPKDAIYVCGVATNYCVYQAIKGFIEAGFKNVTMLTKAVKEIPDETYEPRMRELEKLGVKFMDYLMIHNWGAKTADDLKKENLTAK